MVMCGDVWWCDGLGVHAIVITLNVPPWTERDFFCYVVLFFVPHMHIRTYVQCVYNLLSLTPPPPPPPTSDKSPPPNQMTVCCTNECSVY